MKRRYVKKYRGKSYKKKYKPKSYKKSVRPLRIGYRF